MGKSLVLAEKPSVAREIARVMGCKSKGEGFLYSDKYIVTWALGHLVTLADPEEYDGKYKNWRMEDLPMLPDKMKLVVIKQTSRQFKAVSSLMNRKDVTDLIIATDAGREGELVARWIMIKAGCRLPAKRLWISSQTDRAIKDGFNNLLPAKQYDNLYYSARARAEADWLVGLNVTRALTCKYNAQLSAGRVQTPTLSLIVARENEIRSFVPKDYYSVEADFGTFKATFRDAKNNTRFSDRAFAERVLEEIKGCPAVVTELKKEFRHKAPPAAYDLTELQRDANRRYSYSAKQTLDIMQSLYEVHKVLTYPRTDSRYITDDVAPTLRERLKSICFPPYNTFASKLMRAPIQTKYIVDNKRVSDHHAIIPTEESPDMNRMSRDEKNIYDLVARRFMEVLSAPFEYDEVKVKIKIGRHFFYAKGKIVREPGWKAISAAGFNDDDGEETEYENRVQTLPPLTQGATLKTADARVRSGKTSPPARYTEATLLTAMENPSGTIADNTLRSVMETTGGLGTPATRADIIEKLFDNFSIERHGKEIRPTGKGEQLVKIVPPDLKSAELTAKWELELRRIGEGKADMNAFISRMKKYSTGLVSDVIASDAVFKHDNLTREKCPECGQYLLEVNGKKGKMLVCPDRECGYRRSTSLETKARCPECMKKLELRGEGEKKFFMCRNCGYREKLSDFNKRKESDGANKNDVKKYMQQQSAEAKKSQNNAEYSPFADLLKMFEK